MTRKYNGFIIKPRLQWGQIHTYSDGFPIMYRDESAARNAWMLRGGDERKIDVLPATMTLTYPGD